MKFQSRLNQSPVGNMIMFFISIFLCLCALGIFCMTFLIEDAIEMTRNWINGKGFKKNIELKARLPG